MILDTTVLTEGLEFPESPRWHNGRFWFSDMDAGRVMAVDSKGNREIITTLAGKPSGLGWLPDGSLLVVSMEDQRLLRIENGRPQVAADLSGLTTAKLNDMVVDHKGRAYVGHFGFELFDRSAAPTPAEIMLITPDGGARVVAEGVGFPNGMVITPDDRTLIVAESLGARLTAFDIGYDGSLSGRRVWAQLDDLGFRGHDFARIFPDGICLDAEGAIWVATPWGDAEVLRVVEGGGITDRVKVKTQPFAAMLGGADRRTLFVCTSVITAKGAPAASGRIETVQVDVPGVGRP